MDLEIEGNAALVTASSSGLGKASARALAREGVDVVVNGRDEERLEAAVADIETVAAGQVIGQPGDLTDPDDINTLVETAVSEFGGLDHLVTSAGGPPPKTFLETEPQDWYDAYDLLVMSVVHTVHAAADHLKADGGGTIVCITSSSTREASPTNVLSSSVRMGVLGLEKVLSKELAPEVRANAVLPGPYDTPRIEEMLENQVASGAVGSVDEARAARTENVPVGRFGDPMELGNLVALLSSDQSGFVNGAAIPADGGSSASTL